MQRVSLIFIHGFMGHPSDWDELRAALPEFETKALEMPVAADWQSSLKQLAESIPDQSIVIGYSMGARLVLGVALEFPQRCAGLVFVSGNPGLETDEARQQRWVADQQIAQQLSDQFSNSTESKSLEPFLERWYQADVFATVPKKIRQAEVARKLALSSSAWQTILRSNSVSRQPNYWPRLMELLMPTQVIAGELDEKYREIAVRFDKESPPSNVFKTIVPNCGHIVHREQPEVLVQAIRDLAERVANF